MMAADSTAIFNSAAFLASRHGTKDLAISQDLVAPLVSAPILSGGLRSGLLASGTSDPSADEPVGSLSNDAPSGTDKTLSILEDTTYTFTTADFGFGDPNDASGSLAPALAPTSVLVLYNAASATGLQIANYYASVHPGVQLLGITGIDPNSEDVTADTYLSVIRPQVMAALTSSIDVIVTTKGLPLRVTVTQAAPAGSTYVDGFGVARTILSWKPYSSLESELATIDRVNTWQMMGDQTFAIGAHFSANPYYLSNSAFRFSTFGTRLTARLDAYSTSDVLAMIDRAQQAYIGPNNSPSGPFFFVVDNDPSKIYSSTMNNLVNNVLVPNGLPLVYDNTSAFVSTAPGPVIGYTSHGVHQASAPAEYLLNGVQFALADGAVFESWESYNAYSFNPANSLHGNQGQIGEWLQIGGTAGVGHVEEPGASSSSVTNEDKMFRMLLSGYSFAEAAWSATRQLSFVNTVVGDPLMTWKPWTPGGPNSLAAVKITTLPTGGALTLGGASVSAGQFVSAADIQGGLLRFTPTSNANGVAAASFTFQVQDDGGTTGGGVDLDPTPNTVTFNVTSVNDAPSGANRTLSAYRYTPYVFTAADFGFSDPLDAPANALHVVRIVSLPTAGALTNSGGAVKVGQLISAVDIAAGKFKFTTATDFVGSDYASFSFQVGDNGGTANGGANLDPSPDTLTFNVGISANENLVRGLYFDILGRAPDAGGLAAWTGQLAGGATTLSIVTGLWQCAEHRGRQVDSYYQTFLNRAADAGGRQAWINQMLAGKSEEWVMTAFVSTPEYTTLHPTTTMMAVGLYEDILGRTPGTAEIADRSNSLTAAPSSMDDIVRSLIDSHERHLNLVDSYYQSYLDRQPDLGGRGFWTEQLDRKIMSDAAVAIALLSTPEYFGRQQ